MFQKNDQIVIRNAVIDDAEILCSWWNDGNVMAHAGFPNGLSTNVEQVKRQIEHSNETNRLLIIEIDGFRVGEMNYRIIEDSAEIGIKICEVSYQGHGYGTKVLKMLIEFLFNELKVNKIILDTNLKNERAQYVYEKLGFTKIGVRVNAWKDQTGAFQSAVDYELLTHHFHKAN